PAMSMTLDENRRKPCTVGKPMAFTQARIVDSQGLPVETGVLGEIAMKGGLSFSGYWNNEEETKAIMRDGWIHTGDVGYQDDDGDYYICGRIKNMYISGGENIFPSEIERCLELYPGVHEACVLGVPDERWGEVGKALLVVDSPARFDVEGLREHLGARLSKIKHPRFFEIIETLPKNGAGKRDMRLIGKKYGACPSEKCV
ncbi:MAG: AMP-binding protein, partial [Raoultibacter sp.]